MKRRVVWLRCSVALWLARVAERFLGDDPRPAADPLDGMMVKPIGGTVVAVPRKHTPLPPGALFLQREARA